MGGDGGGIFVGFTHIQFQGLKLPLQRPKVQLRPHAAASEGARSCDRVGVSYLCDAGGGVKRERGRTSKGTGWVGQGGEGVLVGASHLNSSVQSLGFGLMS